MNDATRRRDRRYASTTGSGVRVSEALALKPSDLDLRNGTVRVRHGKGDRARTVALDESAQAYVRPCLSCVNRMSTVARNRLQLHSPDYVRNPHGYDSTALGATVLAHFPS